MASHHQSEKPSQRQGPGQIDYDHDMVILKSQKSLGLQSAACIWPLVPGLGRRARAPGPGPGLRAVGRGPGPRPGALGPGPGPEALGPGPGAWGTGTNEKPAREQTRNRHVLQLSAANINHTVPGGPAAPRTPLRPPGSPCVPGAFPGPPAAFPGPPCGGSGVAARPPGKVIFTCSYI